MSAGDKVNVRGLRPEDYHCSCTYCGQIIGELRQEDGSYYSRLERRHYYAKSEKGKGGHIAKTPLHIARWAIQQYSKLGDWVLDPTIGAGTTAVEAMTQGRSVAGMELQFGDVLKDNIALHTPKRDPSGETEAHFQSRRVQAIIGEGDARNIGAFLDENLKSQKFALVVNNPPYSGDVSMPSPKGKLRGKEHRALETRFDYDKSLPNLAFLKEGQEYWDTLGAIYKECIKRLRPGGYFVIGVKDMIRRGEPFLLHRDLCDLLVALNLEFVGTAFLKHYPGTLFLNSYEKMHGKKPPLYQTINVFKKGKR
jgi:DNA modification methylase